MFSRWKYGYETKKSGMDGRSIVPGRNEFNRPLIFSLAQFYHDTGIWLFGGVFHVLARYDDRYEVELTEIGKVFIGRLKLRSHYRGRTTRVGLEGYYSDFEVQEILREPYSGRAFPGYDGIDLSFDELETLVRNERLDWKVALEIEAGSHAGTKRLGRKPGHPTTTSPVPPTSCIEILIGLNLQRNSRAASNASQASISMAAAGNDPSPPHLEIFSALNSCASLREIKK